MRALGSLFIAMMHSEEAMPAVVSITSRSLVSSVDDYFSFFFGRNSGFGNQFFGGDEGEEVDSGIGSGTIIAQNETELLILTSYHVVEGSSSLYVTFVDDASVDGYVKGVSEATDIAIVAVPLSEIEDSTLAAVRTAKLSVESVSVGEGVIVRLESDDRAHINFGPVGMKLLDLRIAKLERL